MSFEQALKLRASASLLRYLLVSLYQSGADVEKLAKRSESELAGDINVGGRSRKIDRHHERDRKRRDLLKRLFRISEDHGGRFPRASVLRCFCMGISASPI